LGYTGCCGDWTLTEVSDNPQYGWMSVIGISDATMYVGHVKNACTYSGYEAASKQIMLTDGFINGLVDMQNMLDNNVGLDVYIGLPSGASAEDWISYYNGTVATFDAIKTEFKCVEEVYY
jgi:hypothetical protein